MSNTNDSNILNVILSITPRSQEEMELLLKAGFKPTGETEEHITIDVTIKEPNE